MKRSFEGQFLNYFENGDLSTPLVIGNQEGLSFHWSSNIRTIELVKKNCLGNRKGSQRITNLERGLDYLKDVPVWLASGLGKKRTNLYHVYECYMDPRLNSMWQDFKNVSISLSNDLGPYSLVRSMKWFDEKIYAQFIYIKLIRSWMPKRHFRMGLEIPLELSKTKCPLNKFSTKLHQVTEEGIIIQMKCNHLHHFKIEEEVMFSKKGLSIEKNSFISQEFFSFNKWLELLGDFTISGDEFSKIVNTTLKTEERQQAYLFLPYTIIKSKSFEREEIKSSLDAAKKYICKIAA